MATEGYYIIGGVIAFAVLLAVSKLVRIAAVMLLLSSTLVVGFIIPLYHAVEAIGAGDYAIGLAAIAVLFVPSMVLFVFIYALIAYLRG